ncbi:hypothetical protein COU78_00645 [Candidatus Peregrinibacteria bacterium CG10_big_fil_rev_8_21_14_0_10_49_24]|nr:MAG: hypothetical protein COV83_00895 [Candidatus Peregrinibacteria bacterium CG11_big_fil_rev_8_21_14_0_20_49_14]PIR51462.1 MAG: hypothetical protein COU78_00645 [Candidatus Peregrinibacteria bacterium CG10_big_fil_rev_8_21_14_0_10_49_24]PJA67895.1 MAG: hypothetical protein CO157_02695 [Candidatus Peregrinibacteria bacterium CG_4_9_14_3_um_filter_49_12]
MSSGKIILLVIAYLFVFELVLSMKLLGLKEEKLVAPFNWQHTLWMKFSHYLGIVMSKIILTVLWIIGIGPYAMIWQLMHLKKKKPESYWVKVDNENADMKYSF